MEQWKNLKIHNAVMAKKIVISNGKWSKKPSVNKNIGIQESAEHPAEGCSEEYASENKNHFIAFRVQRITALQN